MPGYYQSGDLPKFAGIAEGAPGLWKSFQAWYAESFAEGALSAREKALIGLSVAHVLQCPYCIDAMTEKCLEAGSNLEQMTEAIHAGAAIRAGAALVHGVQMKAVVDRLSL